MRRSEKTYQTGRCAGVRIAGCTTGVFVVSLFLLLPLASLAQISPKYFDYVRRDLTWYTMETEHFLVHFHADSSGRGSSRTARVVAEVAEDIFEPITSLYDHVPDQKVSFILKDYEDYSNGAAYFLDNVIEIWAPALNSPFRGEHNWLRNVISHEFTHMIQVQKSLKGNRKLPFYYLQIIGYEEVQRPDILYGFPDDIISYPFPILNNPAWLAEGTAQYQRAWMDYDAWDSHRDMLLRTRILAGEELSLTDMGGFYSHTGMGREGVYNAGFAFTQYIAHRFGEEGLLRLTEELGKFFNFNFEAAAKDAFGTGGKQIYNDWIAELRRDYSAGIATVQEHEFSGTPIESDGSNNFYARYSPDGTRIAYLSNKGEDYGRTSLYVLDVNSRETLAFEFPEGSFAAAGYTCSFGHFLARPLARMVSGPINWHPDGKSLIYARVRDTKKGHLYSDLYTMQVDSSKETRLTFDERAYAPVYAPDGNRIAFVKSLDGTANLYVFEKSSARVWQLTFFEDGSQITDPAWHPSEENIYFGLSRAGGRDIYRVSVADGAINPVLATTWDERTPAFDKDGDFLYFSSDRTGIYNLYSVRIGSVARQASMMDTDSLPPVWVQLTNEIGGAFMPDVSPDGDKIAYSKYRSTGYAIAYLGQNRPVPTAASGLSYQAPEILTKSRPNTSLTADQQSLNNADDTGIPPFPENFLPARRSADSASYIDDGTTRHEISAPRRYEDIFTSFSFMPVLRFDNYVGRQRNRTQVRLQDRTRAETLWRNTKFGFYTTSREILGGLSMFGGLLIGPGSRSTNSNGSFLSPSNLLKLERDLFLQFDYNRGLGIIPNRWSPQISLELINVGRNVDNGLAIEEFPCTACFPDTTLAHLRYNLWEVNLSLRSKVNRTLLVEIGYRYSPYRVTTEAFFSKELQLTVTETSVKYYIGRAGRIKIYYDALKSYRDADVVPDGTRIEAIVENEVGQLLEGFTLDDGFLKPQYETSNFNRLTVSGRFYFRLPGISGRQGAHGLGVRLRASSILGGSVDAFYDDYVGGLTGARGYPYFALGGNRTLWGQLSYTFPVFPRIGRQFLWLYVDKVYARVYADAALAWTGSSPDLDKTRKDAGAELRISLGSFYLFPTAFFVSSTYAIDRFAFKLDDGFITPDGKDFVEYGGVWKWHVGVLFGFDQF